MVHILKLLEQIEIEQGFELEIYVWWRIVRMGFRVDLKLPGFD